MPYPNQHACRCLEPLPSGTSITATKSIAPGINIILQRRKNEPSMKTQSYRFDKNKFTAQEAKAWLKDHNVSCTFEAASEPSKKENRKDIINRITKELSGAIIK